MSGKLEAVIWDMDGVIVDSGPYHFRAWQDVFYRRGVPFAEADFRHNFGKRNDTIIRYAMGQGISAEEVGVIAVEKEESFRRRVASNIEALPGVSELLDALRKSGVKMAIASSAPTQNIELITGELGIRDCFDAVVWGGEVTEGKPSPQGYLLAAQKLGVAPQDCVVIEDAVAGVTGARKAGMRCLAVTNSHPRESLKEADLVVDSLERVSTGDLESLFTRVSDQVS